jgi:hypothetical protein
VTHDYRVEGPVMLMLTTTAIDVDPELLNRCLVLTVDEEPAQTAAIQQAQRAGRTLAGLTAHRERAAVASLHQNAQRLLRPLAVVNPHAPALSFAAGQTRLRRDHAKYLALIDAVAFLHQHQRDGKTHVFADGSALQYIEVTRDDIALANKLAAAVLGRSVDELPPQTRALWDGLCRHVQAEAERTVQPVGRISFDRRGAAAALGWSYKQVRQHLDRLVAEDFAVVMTSGLGQVTRYRLVDGLDEAGRFDLRLGAAQAHAPAPAPEPVQAPAPAPASPHAPTCTMTTLPINTGGCPYPAQEAWAGSNADEMQANGTDSGGSAHEMNAHMGGYHLPGLSASQMKAAMTTAVA